MTYGLKLDPEVKAKWVAALEDPKTEQAQGTLKRREAMCCLGVLCNIYDPTRWFFSESAQKEMYGDPEGESKGLLPIDEVMKWAFPSYSLSFPSVEINGETTTLSAHNDQGRSFLEIAKAIREQL